MSSIFGAERKVLEVDKKRVCALLEAIGASKILDTKITIEAYDIKDFNGTINGVYPQQFATLLEAISMFCRSKGTQATLQDMGASLQLKQEGKHVRLILELPPNKEGVKAEGEFYVPVKLSEWDSTKKWLRTLGFKQISFQEKHRISFHYTSLNVQFSVDTWPGVPPYIKISGNNCKDIIKAAGLIGYGKQHLDSIEEKDLLKRYSVSSTYLSFDEGKIEKSHGALTSLVKQVALKKAPHLREKDLSVIANHYISAEYSGKKTHGLRKFCWDAQFYPDRLSAPEIRKENAVITLLDGKREIGALAAQICTDIVIKKARSQGVALVAMTGTQRFGTLASWTEQIAKAGLIGIVTVSTEPFTALPETAKGVIGTNPLSIAVPYHNNPIVYDAALSKAPVNTIWLNKLLGINLPDKTFIDSAGSYTLDPQRAQYVDAFGGHKGAGLGLMLQILSGPLMGIPSNKSFEDSYKNGFYFQAVNPTFFQSEEDFNELVESLVVDIKEAPLRKGFSEPLLPGEKSSHMFSQTSQQNAVTVSKAVINWMNFLRDS